uniref:DUF443 family protein n=1 Tax=Staphylococcus saprophyticus TaxID=29385 RepID=A0A0K2W9P0_STASA|nr:hypothetical protein [Staphylococcus saprophyticus]
MKVFLPIEEFNNQFKRDLYLENWKEITIITRDKEVEYILTPDYIKKLNFIDTINKLFVIMTLIVGVIVFFAIAFLTYFDIDKVLNKNFNLNETTTRLLIVAILTFTSTFFNNLVVSTQEYTYTKFVFGILDEKVEAFIKNRNAILKSICNFISIIIIVFYGSTLVLQGIYTTIPLVIICIFSFIFIFYHSLLLKKYNISQHVPIKLEDGVYIIQYKTKNSKIYIKI